MNRFRLDRHPAAMIAVWALLSGCLTACRESPGPARSADVGSITNYTVGGLIRELKPGGTNVIIRHDRIPGYMEAMTMSFDATNPAVLHGLKTNDVVRFQFHVTADDSWVDGFQVLSNAGPAQVHPEEVVLNDPSGVTFFKEVAPLQIGDELPNYVLTNQLGKSFNLNDYRGKVLAFNFIFTRCPMPDFCPRLTARFQSAQNALKKRADAPAGWQLLSITIDPVYDTPQVLTGYGTRHAADPARWMFATGNYDQLLPLGSHFGQWFAIKVTPDKLTHNLRTVVLDRGGKVRKVFEGNEWSSEELVNALMEAGK